MITLTNVQGTEKILILRSYDDINAHIRILELISLENNLIEAI
jgi:hypothetical protein